MNEPPDGASCRPWKFDTACAPAACAWRFHLEQAGLDPSDPGGLFPRPMTVRLANDAVEAMPVRRAALWLVSNIPALRSMPYRLGLYPGLPFYDRSPRRPQDTLPLIGMRAFRRARLKVQIDFAAATMSVWTPGSWSDAFTLFLRRLPGRHATIPLAELCPEGWR